MRLGPITRSLRLQERLGKACKTSTCRGEMNNETRRRSWRSGCAKHLQCLQHKEFVLMTPTYGIVCLDAYDLICVG
jgi:SOS-response transcriptional repressor LexA